MNRAELQSSSVGQQRAGLRLQRLAPSSRPSGA